MIKSFEFSGAKNDPASNKLLDRYENADDLIEFHNKGLCKITPMSKGSYIDWRRIINDAENYITTLESLGESLKIAL